MNEKMKYIGLSDGEVTDSRREHGWNVLTPPKKTPLWRLYLEKYTDPIIEILLVAALVSLVLAFFEHQYVETIGIFVAIFLATTVGFVFEYDAAKKFDVLTQLNEEQRVKVVRNGMVTTVKRREIVVGDVVIVETGDEIPADGMLLEAVSLQVDESMLTGEPLTTKGVKAKDAEKGMTDDESYAIDFVMRSTMVMNGRGMFAVTAVGDETQIGHVARLSTEKSDVKTPLNLQLDRLGKFINKFGFSLSIIAALLFLGHDMLTNDLWHTDDYLGMVSVVLRYFMMAVTLIVMAVPEGLPMAVTLALALNMRRMLKSHNLVRRLHACETMGAVTVICTDKTGTLTENKMQVAEHNIIKGMDEAMVHTAIALNTTANLEGNNGIGNPTEVALLLWSKGRGYDYLALRNDVEVVEQTPFSTETKQMQTIVRMRGGEEHVFVKGAPEIVMAQCEVDDDLRHKVENTLLGYQQKAMRTLALAVDGHLQAVFAISDPIRAEVSDAISECHSAGIKVIVVTGDVTATAMEIARQGGILSGDDDADKVAITGAEFMTLSDDEAQECVKRIKVMSRARPQDKQRLVQMLQKSGEVVAVTGDGTNDAPALNYAHVGLSLGSGTNVAKEASDMTLMDDSFLSIVNAVMWGRSLYKNIQRFLYFQLVVNVAALLLVIGGSLIGTEMPLTVTQILWVNLIMDTFAALALSSLPPSHEVMKAKPRKQSDFILSKDIITGILTMGIILFVMMFVFLIYCERDSGVNIHELTIFFTVFVMLQWWNLFNAKCIGSSYSAFRRLWAAKGFNVVLVATLVGQWAIVTFGGEMFRCEPLSVMEWIIIILATSPVMIAGEVYRKIRR